MRRSTAEAIALGMMTACASAPVANPQAAGASSQILKAARTDGSAPLALKLKRDEAGRPIGFLPASEDDADLVVVLKITDRGTSAKIFNRAREHIKLDMRISPDGEKFAYTSSCPIRAQRDSFELWIEPIKILEVSNPRIPNTRELGGCF